MHRRTFFGALAALSSALFARPTRAARGGLQRLRTRFGAAPSTRWSREPVVYGDWDMKVVARVYREASQVPTLVTDGFFEAAMHDIPDPDPEYLALAKPTPDIKLELNASGNALWSGGGQWATRDTSWRRRVMGLNEDGEARLYYVGNPGTAEARERYERQVLNRHVKQGDGEFPDVRYVLQKDGNILWALLKKSDQGQI